jgi:GNAT superfamily N-acetyltransferase
MAPSSSESVICRPARVEDIPALAELCARWQRDQVETTQNGFLQLRYGAETFGNLLAEDSVIVAEEDGLVAGYYLVNPRSSDPAVSLHRNKVEQLLRDGLIPTGARVALGSQALLDSSLQGRGIRQMLLAHLVKHLTGRYDLLFATIPKDNTRAFRAHTGDGWQIIDEDERMHYVFWPMPKRSCPSEAMAE